MKQLTDAERLEVAMGILDEHQVDDYANRCAELEQDCEANGFYDVPAECEDKECKDCKISNDSRRIIGCPYVD